MTTKDLTSPDLLLFAISVWFIYKSFYAIRLRMHTTRLNGPPTPSWLYGVTEQILTNDSGTYFEKWMEKYGLVFQIPGALGYRRTVLCDPKAIAHFYAKETTVYDKPKDIKHMAEGMVGRGILWADGDVHKRQRKALAPAFSVASIRNATPYFFDSAYKVKTAWESTLESSSVNETVLDIQTWMNHVSLDSVGAAGFSHHFGTLDGKYSSVAEAFDSLNDTPRFNTMALLVQVFSPIVPIVAKIPMFRMRLIKELKKSLNQTAKALLRKRRTEDAEVDVGTGDGHTRGVSILEALMKVDNTESEFRMSEEEVLAQMNVLILAGYQPTSITLTWAFIELARHPEKQARLREELNRLGTADPTFDQLANSFPYLNAVTCETIRLHAPIQLTNRVARVDDTIPLSTPIVTASGKVVDCIHVARGTDVVVPVRCMNRSTSIWGPDAKEFVPERWLNNENGLTQRAKELQGFHHTLSFIDGPRTCLGKSFAVTEIKTVLAVLMRNFEFSLRDGPETKVGIYSYFTFRPGVDNEGCAIPMRIRKVAA